MRGALERLAISGSALTKYADGRDTPAIDGTSRLSPYLKFGNVSVRTIYEACRHSDKFVDELAWREFYWHVLWHWPEVETAAWQEGRRSLMWDDSPDLLEFWKQGQTGYPMVDAGMRQLMREGWMHNRVRMIVSSFLTMDCTATVKKAEALHAALWTGPCTFTGGGSGQRARASPRPLRISTRHLSRSTILRELHPRYVPELGSVPLITAPARCDGHRVSAEVWLRDRAGHRPCVDPMGTAGDDGALSAAKQSNKPLA